MCFLDMNPAAGNLEMHPEVPCAQADKFP